MKNRIRAELLEHGALATIQNAIDGNTPEEIEKALLKILDIVLQEQKNHLYMLTAKKIHDAIACTHTCREQGNRYKLLQIMMEAITQFNPAGVI